jgi:hypothetical protein
MIVSALPAYFASASVMRAYANIADERGDERSCTSRATVCVVWKSFAGVAES